MDENIQYLKRYRGRELQYGTVFIVKALNSSVLGIPVLECII